MSFIGVTFQDRRLYIPKPATWNQMLAKVSQSFSLNDEQAEQLRVLYRPDLCDESPSWELDHEAWDGVRDGSSIHLEIGNLPEREPSVGAAIIPERVEDHVHVSVTSVPEKEITFGVEVCQKSSPSHSTVWYTAKPSTLVGKLLPLIRIQPVHFRLLFHGKALDMDRSFADQEIEDWDILEVSEIHYGGKPAIYLLPPHTLSDVEVEVTLCPEWTFSVLFPLTTPSTTAYSGRTAASWTVDVQPDGTIQDSKTGIECSYLFWEAESRPSQRGDCASTADLDSFNPAVAQPFLQHLHEVLPFEQFVTRMDAILKDLCLTAAMRTEFIVYWLPAFQRIRDRDQLIKFTFVPQDSFEKAAAICISGVKPPKAISRVFLLFSGIDPGSDDSRTPIDWATHIGLDQEIMEDVEAFRVLEWGGMEVRV